MNFLDKYTVLNKTLFNALIPLINGNYHLVDLPYHSNIGDTLIWQGELELLSQSSYKCLSQTTRITFMQSIEQQTDSATCILFHGGGNLGQLYREHIEYLFELIDNYPNHRIIVFPQTINYTNMELFAADIERLKKHKDFHFCVRDRYGFDLLKTQLKHVYLLPDMAFCIPLNYFSRYKNPPIKGSLYLKRVDTEIAAEKLELNTDYMLDWPTFYHKLNDGTFIAKILDNLCKSSVFGRYTCVKKAWDWWALNVYRKDLIRIGAKFVKSYEPIYTTRLHVMILSLLCGKSVTVIDNSYKKNTRFVETWLSDIQELSCYNDK